MIENLSHSAKMSLSRRNFDSPNALVYNEIARHVTQANYPCIAAVKSFLQNDFLIGCYSGFGTDECSQDLGSDLLSFKQQQKERKSLYFSFWAGFPDSKVESEAQFEELLWKQLSLVSSHSVTDEWDPNFSSDPLDKNFCFSLDGSAYFIVGMHPMSSRRSRQTAFPILAFNLYDQFHQLMAEEKFEPMVQINRNRELRFQGDINPMVKKHGQEWEAIQFSGQNNPDTWKCPFHHASHGKK